MDKHYRILHEIDINNRVLVRQKMALTKIIEQMDKTNISFRKLIQLGYQNNYHFEVCMRILDQNKKLLEEAKTLIED